MRKNKQEITRLDKKSLKQCIKKLSPGSPLFFIFQLSSHLREIEEMSQSSELQNNDIFTLHSVNECHFLCIHENIESSDSISPASFQQIARVIKKNYKNNPQTLGIAIDARFIRIAESNELFKIGQNVRAQVDVIRNVTAQNIPILLVIHNMEDIEGFESWTQSLDDSRLDEAFGFATPEDEIEAQSFISAAFRSFNERLLPSEQPDNKAAHQFLQTLLSLKRNLVALTNGLNQTQPDLIPPKFIGLYFMGMVNHPVHQTDEPDDTPVLMRKTAFVSDVCNRIFPQAASYGSYFKPESRHGFLSKVMILSIVLCLLMTVGGLCFMYWSHKSTLQNTSSNIGMLQKNITTPQDAIGYFHSLNHHIVSLDSSVSDWWLPWLGLSSDKHPLNDLKQNYVKTFRKYLLKPLIDQFLDRLRRHLSKRSAVEDSDHQYHQVSGQLMGTLVYFVDYGNQFMGTRQKEGFVFHPKAYHDGKGIFEHPISGDRFKQFMDCYTNAMRWENNRRQFRKDFHLLKTSIEEMVTLMPNLMEWMFPIVKSQQKDINLLNLWIKGMQANDPNTKINAAFSKSGYTYIYNFFQLIRQSQTTPSRFDALAKKFYAEYETKYLQEWEQAAKKFERMSNYLKTRESWVDIIFKLHDIQSNPFFQMIDMIESQTQPFINHQKKWPQWLQYCHRLHNQTLLANVNNALTQTTKITRNTETSNVFDGYVGALKKIAQIPNTPEVSFQLIKTLFVNPGTFCPGEGPDTIACLSIFQLQSIWNKKKQDNAVFWDLYEGPVAFIRKFSARETACHLQQNWEDMVVSVDLQTGKDSLVKLQKKRSQEFINTYANPFLEKITQSRYAPKRQAGLVVPFRDSFFKYVAYHPRPQEKLKERYPVMIKATPSRTNALASSQPQLTLIKMKCEQNQQIMVIGHQPVQETFYWSESCGPVHVTFHLKDMKITRSYPNPMAFPKFVRDVQYGSKRFQREEFVLDTKRLKSMNIDYLELKLQLFGHESIAKAQKRGFITAPEKITYCWEESTQLIKTATTDKSKKEAESDNSEKMKKEPPSQKQVKTTKPQAPPAPQKKEIEKPDVPMEADIYIVILASFRNDKNAVKKAKKFTKDGLNAAVYWLKDKNDNPWYIVVSGMFATYGQAMKSVEQITKNFSLKPFIKKMERNTIDERKVNINF
jgi:type VI secretion system protein ImpL